MTIELVRQCLKTGFIRITLHARMEMDIDEVSTDEVIGAITAPNSEIIEDYADDPRGHSHLLLAWLARGDPIHICCAVHGGELIIITIYRPDAMQWNADWRTRK